MIKYKVLTCKNCKTIIAIPETLKIPKECPICERDSLEVQRN